MDTIVFAAQKSSARTKPRGRWLPTRWSVDEKGSYRLAPSVADRLLVELRDFKNRDAAHRLAVFLARFHATPKRLIDEPKAFAIDRRALAGRPGLDLSEDQIRGAIKTLLQIGFLALFANPGRLPGRRTALPTQYVFNGWYKDRFTFLARKAKSPKYRDSFNILDSTSREALYSGDLVHKQTKWVPRRRVLAPAPTRVECYDPRAEDNGLADALSRFAEAFRSREQTTPGLTWS